MNDALMASVSRLTGRRARSLVALDAGMSSSETYLARLDGGQVVVKVNADVSTLFATRHNLAVLAQLGIPVPELIAYDDSGADYAGAIVVMEHLEGTDLGQVIDSMTPSQLSRLAREIVDIQCRVATLPPNTGCGFVGIGAPASRTWSDVVHHPDSNRTADPAPPDSAHLLPLLERSLRRAEPYFAQVAPTAFLDDATTKNVTIP